MSEDQELRVVRIEERVSSLKEDIQEIKEAVKLHTTFQTTEIMSLKTQQKELVDAVAKWKQGAGLVFLLGAVAMWAIDHWTWLVSQFRH